MSVFNIFRSNYKKTANVAKDRLQIIVAHERSKKSGLNLPLLKQDLIDVIAKYVEIKTDQVDVKLQNASDCAILELNITLPEPNGETDPKDA